jgi:glutamate racemase
MIKSPSNPIGVFDSGVGGLTVYKALREALPRENFIYLGDTARLPYGTKSPETVAQYALQAARLMMDENIKLLVVACNTASALGLPSLHYDLPHLPCLGVIEPSAKEAANVSKTGSIAVLATESTVRSGTYATTIKKHRPDANVKMLACNLLVSMAEEGWCEGPEAEAVIGRYLAELGNNFDTLVLGCTHFPLLAHTIRKLIGPDIRIVDSAATTAKSVQNYLKTHHLVNEDNADSQSRFLVTDSPERFGVLAKRFLNSEFIPSIELANLSPPSHTNTSPYLKTANAP